MPDDVPVVSAVIAGGAEGIVPGDRGLLEDAPLRRWLEERGVAMWTPAQLVQQLGA